MAVSVLVWWIGLAIIGVIGMARWLQTSAHFAKHAHTYSPSLLRARRWQLRLSGIYAFGCAFRGVFPRADVQRICLVDSWLSSVMLGRTVATVAELAFAIQWALILGEAARGKVPRLPRLTAKLVVPVIVVAEICSWYAVVTTNFLGNAIEQSLWDVSVAMLCLSMLSLLPHYGESTKRLFYTWLGFGVAFVMFVTTIDVPMYVSRYLADEARSAHYFGLVDGLRDVATRWVVTFAWEDWRDEMAWMTLYFSAAVWLSTSLVRVPWLGDEGHERSAAA